MHLFNSTTMFLVYGFIAGLLIFYLIFFYRKWKFIKFSWKINGFFIPILPIVGTSYVSLFSGLKVNPISLIQWAEEYVKFPFIFWFGHSFNYVTSDANEAKIILTHPKCYNKAAFYESLKYFFGGSLLLAPLGNTGLNDDQMFSDMGRVGEILTESQKLLGNLLLNPFLRPDLWRKWFPSGRATDKLFEEGKTYVTKLIEEKRREQEVFQTYIENSQRVSLLDLMLIVDNRFLTDDEIFEELTFFGSAATDTSGFTLAFCFVLLGMYPEIQETIYKEVTDLIGDCELTFEDVPNLKYTEAVIYETLRIFPVVPIVGRVCDDDVDLGTKILPKGTSCMISIYHIHRNPENWPDPLKFDPTRFLPENQLKIKPYTFLGFSGGPRDCIGKAQAMILMKTTIANIVRNFAITTKHQSIEELCLESCITMKTSNPLDCHFQSRHKK